MWKCEFKPVMMFAGKVDTLVCQVARAWWPSRSNKSFTERSGCLACLQQISRRFVPSNLGGADLCLSSKETSNVFTVQGKELAW